MNKMKEQELTPEQKKDIEARFALLIEEVKKYEFTLSAQVIATNIGDDVFGFKVVPSFQDTKYLAKKEEAPVVAPTEPKITDVEATEVSKDEPTISPYSGQPE